ncbi:MAG TPA: molybdenum cofactor biosynthesis protein MoaE [Microbacteriaceae bacterium]|nr:molybdenum cofactor biosynthesis protein MoaE [Microbacteriaceae bacterium]
MSAVRIARVIDAPLDLAAHIAAVTHPGAGAIATFLGTVRHADPDASGEVVALEYTAHPDVEAVLHRIASEVAAETTAALPVEDGPDEVRIAVSHRYGRLAVGDAAVVIAVSTGHRAAAFQACREVIERIKDELPVWKRQVEADGTTAWKGLGG